MWNPTMGYCGSILRTQSLTMLLTFGRVPKIQLNQNLKRVAQTLNNGWDLKDLLNILDKV